MQRINAGGQEQAWGWGDGGMGGWGGVGTKGRAIRRRICRNLSALWLQQVHERKKKQGLGRSIFNPGLFVCVYAHMQSHMCLPGHINKGSAARLHICTCDCVCA